MLDFIAEFEALQPDYFVVNADGNTPEKQLLCKKHGVEYIILNREPHTGLPARSTTNLRTLNQIPFRIDLAGGWLDQPYVSKYYPGSVITISLEPTYRFNDRSGMASSTRQAAIDLWGPKIPPGNLEKLAKVLFCYDNPPGTEVISGSQDSIGIVLPGLAKAFYDGRYWPEKIDRIIEEPYLKFVESSLYLVTLGPRHAQFDVLDGTRINRTRAKALSEATDHAWEAVKNMDLNTFAEAVRASFESQVAMFPNMMNENIAELIEQHKEKALGWKLSGAGGGGYLILVSDKTIKNAMKVIARRPSDC
jgi:hypothetical protein